MEAQELHSQDTDINEIFGKIIRLRTEFRIKNINRPNMICMDMEDYHALCKWCEDVSRDKVKPEKILGMIVVKRSGKMECMFDETISSEGAYLR